MWHWELNGFSSEGKIAFETFPISLKSWPTYGSVREAESEKKMTIKKMPRSAYYSSHRSLNFSAGSFGRIFASSGLQHFAKNKHITSKLKTCDNYQSFDGCFTNETFDTFYLPTKARLVTVSTGDDLFRAWKASSYVFAFRIDRIRSVLAIFTLWIHEYLFHISLSGV